MIIRIPGTVEQDGQRHVLVLEDGQKIVLAKSDAAGISAGDRMVVRIAPDSQDSEDGQKLARTLLNELIGDDA